MTTLLDIALILVPFIIVAAVAPRVIGFCRDYDLISDIDNRRAHKNPTPHGGGILLVAIIVPMGLLIAWLTNMPHKLFFTVMLLASLPIAYMGWLDDHKNQNPILRLATHILCASVAMIFMPPLFDFVPLVVEKVILVLAWAWFVNLYNFMDGLDGLATSEAIFLGIAIALFAAPFKPFAAMVAGTCFGFLRVNWSPAKVFLGDVGSTFLGFILGGLLFVSLADNTWQMVYPIFTLTLVFTLDTTYTLIKRVLQGHKPWVPHRDFWFHRAAKLGYSHAQIVGRIALLNFGLLCVAIFGLALGLGPITILLGIVLLVWPAYKIRKMEMWGQ